MVFTTAVILYMEKPDYCTIFLVFGGSLSMKLFGLDYCTCPKNQDFLRLDYCT